MFEERPLQCTFLCTLSDKFGYRTQKNESIQSITQLKIRTRSRTLQEEPITEHILEIFSHVSVLRSHITPLVSIK